jgi:hypothetical protein
LIERTTGRKFDTVVEKIIPESGQFIGWNFDWTEPVGKNYETFALFIKNDSEKMTQGIIAIRVESENQAVYGYLLESNPRNVGKDGLYIGVGAHLTAYGCKVAKDNGFEVYYFDAKTDLIDHYASTLGAKRIGQSQRMVIDGDAFEHLIKQYYPEGQNGR